MTVRIDPKTTEATTHEEKAWQAFDAIRQHFQEDLLQWPITPELTGEKLRELLGPRYSFQEPRAAEDLVREVSDLLREGTVHVTHPSYFGLFNPSVRPITILADALTALFNPQLAAWSHAPAANELERHTLAFFRAKLGLDPELGGGCFTTGGGEANLSGVTLALATRCPAWKVDGIRGLPGHPRIYVSEEAHHSFDKIVAQTGLGTTALCKVPVDHSLRMRPDALRERVARDRAEGYLPLLVVGTAGTTGAGAIDPLRDLAAIASEQDLWFHVDAAWGGFACLCPDHAGCLDGIDRADSVTWDAHKGLSVPMGAGMFFCRERSFLERAFGIETGYMPAATTGALDPYTSTAQWSRRFIGLKVFMALAELGEAGYGRLIGHQFCMGASLRRQLLGAGWRVVNDTPLPLVCFVHPAWTDGDGALDRVVEAVQAQGRAWVSKVRLSHHGWALRACITSYHTDEAELQALVRELDHLRGTV